MAARNQATSGSIIKRIEKQAHIIAAKKKNINKWQQRENQWRASARKKRKSGSMASVASWQHQWQSQHQCWRQHGGGISNAAWRMAASARVAASAAWRSSVAACVAIKSGIIENISEKRRK